MNNNIEKLAERTSDHTQQAYEIYLPLTEELCKHTVSEDELEHHLDYILDYAFDERIVNLFKKICRNYLCIYPNCIKSYIEIYKEVWDSESDCSLNLFQHNE